MASVAAGVLEITQWKSMVIAHCALLAIDNLTESSYF